MAGIVLAARIARGRKRAQLTCQGCMCAIAKANGSAAAVCVRATEPIPCRVPRANRAAQMSEHRRRTVDIHAHWYPAEWLHLFAQDGAAEGAKLERSAQGYSLRTERLTNAFDDRFVDLGSRLEAMDRIGVDVHALSLTTPMVYWASPGLGLALSQAFN